MAANHWQTAIEVHQAHFPGARHDCADISQADPRRYPRTDILLASPECTNHSQARGVSRRRQDPTLWDAPDPAAERSRATMWDVVRFAEQLAYDAIVVENVVEATRWVGWRAWCIAMEDLGYDRRVLSHNSMHHGVPQSRDRIYVVFTPPTAWPSTWRWNRAPTAPAATPPARPPGVEERPHRRPLPPAMALGVHHLRHRLRTRRRARRPTSSTGPCPAPASVTAPGPWPPPPGPGSSPGCTATAGRRLTAGAGHVHERLPAASSARGTASRACTRPATAHGAPSPPHPTVCGSDDRLAFVVPAPVGPQPVPQRRRADGHRGRRRELRRPRGPAPAPRPRPLDQRAAAHRHRRRATTTPSSCATTAAQRRDDHARRRAHPHHHHRRPPVPPRPVQRHRPGPPCQPPAGHRSPPGPLGPRRPRRRSSTTAGSACSNPTRSPPPWPSPTGYIPATYTKKTRSSSPATPSPRPSWPGSPAGSSRPSQPRIETGTRTPRPGALGHRAPYGRTSGPSGGCDSWSWSCPAGDHGRPGSLGCA